MAQSVNTNPTRVVQNSIPEDNDRELDKMLYEALNEMKLEDPATTTTTSTTSSRPPMPTPSLHSEEKELEEVMKSLLGNSEAFQAIKQMMQDQEKRIATFVDEKGNIRKIRINEDKLDETDIIFVQEMGQTIESMMSSPLSIWNKKDEFQKKEADFFSRLIREGKAVEIMGHPLTLKIEKKEVSNREIEKRVQLLTDFGIDGETAQKMAPHPQFSSILMVSLLEVSYKNPEFEHYASFDIIKYDSDNSLNAIKSVLPPGLYQKFINDMVSSLKEKLLEK